MTVQAKFKETEIGKIPADWEIRSLTELISHVVDNRGKTAPTSNNGIALIATNCIKEDGLYPIKEKIRYVSQETYDNWFRNHPKTGDIIIVNKGTPGLVCLVPEKVDFCIAQDMVAIRPKDTYVYGKYLFTAMRSKNFKFQVDGLNVGTTIPHLKKTVFSKLLIPVPPMGDQIFIGNTYCSLSEKIELNRQMNSTLEAIGQALFRRWFVDFEFPDEEGKPYRSSGGEMMETELGEVPKGWRIGMLGEFCDIIMGQSPPGTTYNEIGDGLPFYQGITDFGFRFPGRRVYCTAPTRFAEEGDVLLSVRAPVGSLNVADERCAIGRGVAALRMKGKQHGYLYYLLCATQSGWNKFEAEGTVFGSVNKADVHDFNVILPPETLRNRFGSLVEPLDKQITVNEKQIRTLTAIREALLPKLICGKIRVDKQENE